MAAKKKLIKFADLATFSNVYENLNVQDPKINHLGEVVERRGSWAREHFGNDNPIVLELACGGGEYTCALAERDPDRNFIGVDLKGNRIWKGSTLAQQNELQNAAFLRTRIEQIDLFFAPGEIEQIWITFPDPYLRPSKARKRLTSPRFLKVYYNILHEGGLIHLKTDSPQLYEYTLEVAEEQPVKVLYHDNNIYNKVLPHPALDIKTYYEGMHLADGRLIKYVQMRLTDEPIYPA